MKQDSSIRLWTVTSSLCSISRLAGWFLLRKVTKNTTLLFLCICQKSTRKSQKNICGMIYWQRKLQNYITPLNESETQQRRFARNLTQVLFAALKNKKALTTVMERTLRFKVVINGQTQRTPIRSQGKNFLLFPYTLF